jgi:hypothetical protein
MLIAGICQFILGVFCAAKFGARGYRNGAVGVSVYVIHFPILNIITGLLQALLATWGIARSWGYATRTVEGARGDNTFQRAVWAFFIFQIIFQVVVQVGYAKGDLLAAAAPAIAATCLPMCLMPAFLDWKAQQSPESISADHFGGEESSDSDDNQGVKRVTTVTQVTRVQETNTMAEP